MKDEKKQMFIYYFILIFYLKKILNRICKIQILLIRKKVILLIYLSFLFEYFIILLNKIIKWNLSNLNKYYLLNKN